MAGCFVSMINLLFIGTYSLAGNLLRAANSHYASYTHCRISYSCSAAKYFLPRIGHIFSTPTHPLIDRFMDLKEQRVVKKRLPEVNQGNCSDHYHRTLYFY